MLNRWIFFALLVLSEHKRANDQHKDYQEQERPYPIIVRPLQP